MRDGQSDSFAVTGPKRGEAVAGAISTRRATRSLLCARGREKGSGRSSALREDSGARAISRVR